MDCQALALAIQEIAAHPALGGVITRKVEANRAEVEFDLDLDFGDRWRALGQSPNGVKAVERVRFAFDRDFPISAIIPSLRPDFSREHAHVQLGLTADGRVIPCVVDGPLDEFVAANGLYGLVDQTWRWLKRAADGDLENGASFWEPMRRDHVSESLFADWTGVDTMIRAAAGFAFLPCAVTGRGGDREAERTYRGRAIAQKVAGHVVTDLLKRATDDHKRGVALVLWADRRLEDGGERIEGAYAPDSVSSFADLEALAQHFGMGLALRAGLAALAKSATGLAGVVPLPIILLVRRPRNIQGTESPIEHVGYLARIALPTAAVGDPEVQPLACYDDLSPRLLRRLSGETKPRAWALLGAGSLGSKIAMHRARSGVAPEFVVDPKWLQAHNAARHALHATPAEDLHLAWLDPKAVALADAISSLAQTTRAIRARHPAILQEMADRKTSKLAWLLNSTASVVVRDWLGGPEGQAAPRGAEAGLFDGGGLGYLAFEGSGRNPDGLDLMGALYALARRRPKVAAAVFKSDGQLDAVRIGEGCASTTMVMSDARLSAMAAPMAELLADADPEAESGMIHLLQRDGIGLTHEAIPVGAHLRLPLEGLDGWTVSLSPEVGAAITAEAANSPKSETGGVLLGRVSVIARRIQVVDLVPAPADSKRSATEFVLGVEGLTDQLTAIAEETAAALVCVGTWHSHLGSAAPSARDRASAGIVGTWEARPMVFLIRGGDGWRAVSAASPLVSPRTRRRRGARGG